MSETTVRVQLRHFAAEPVTLDLEREYEQRVTFKPHGFWFTVPGDTDWPTWCRQEQFGEDRLAVEHEVVLAPSANILVIESVEALDEFAREYHVELYPGLDSRTQIDWPRLTAEFDGILITPYFYSRRWTLTWYSAWDVASGCIWNLDAIESLRVVQS